MINNENAIIRDASKTTNSKQKVKSRKMDKGLSGKCKSKESYMAMLISERIKIKVNYIK